MHNVRKTNATITEHIDALPKDKRKELLKKLDAGYSATFAEETMSGSKRAELSPEQAICISAIKCFIRIHAQIAAAVAEGEVVQQLIAEYKEKNKPPILTLEEMSEYFKRLS